MTAELKTQKPASPHQAAIVELGAAWIAARNEEGRITSGTITKYKADLRAWGELPELTLPACVSHARTWKVATRTSRRRWQILRAVISWAQTNNLLDTDITELLEHSPRPTANAAGRTISGDSSAKDLADILGATWEAALRIGSPVEQAVLICQWRAGLSPTEIVSLKPNALDQTGLRLWVEGGRARQVPLSPGTAALLNTAAASHMHTTTLLGHDRGETSYPLSQRWIRSHLDKLAKAAGVTAPAFAETRVLYLAELLAGGHTTSQAASQAGCDIRQVTAVTSTRFNWRHHTLNLPGPKP